ncbi:MAG: alpha/beta fold hydrolase [Myxococcales bacterium]|nr:alpha/beta fold hydrolase [Myxococcales bacterium]
MPLSGHLWTIGASLRHRVRPAHAPEAMPWATTLIDPDQGQVRLRGLYRRVPGADRCAIVVHGLGGTTDTFYCVAAARAVEARGWSCLRLALRGADRGGDDFYHAGLVEDLAAAVTSPELAHYERIYLLGYSLGGHLCLRYGQCAPDRRVAALAAVCPPLDLARGAQGIDQRRSVVYRRHVLSGLNEIYAAVAARRPVPTPVEEVMQATTIRAWDALTVVPRYGFDNVDHYYGTMSAGPQLHALQRPALIVHSEHDPMVPVWSYRDHLQRELPRVQHESLKLGGHVSFPARVRFRNGRVDPLDRQVLDWLAEY